MKGIPFRADESLTEKTQLLAKSEGTSLSTTFREWLQRFASRVGDLRDFDGNMQRLRHINSGRRFSRDEMNQR